MSGFEFTACDGKRYRTTGEFRACESGEVHVHGRDWPDPDTGRPATTDSRSSDYPVIIVELVEPTYIVEVELSEELLNNYRDWGVGAGLGSAAALLSEAIKEGKYREVTE